MDWLAAGTLLGGVGAFIAAVTAVPGAVSRQLRKCEAREVGLRDKISALESEMVAMRKLMPPGEWWVKLFGIDEIPPAPARRHHRQEVPATLPPVG